MTRETRYNGNYPKVVLHWLNQVLCFYQRFYLGDSELFSPVRMRQVRNLPGRLVGQPLRQATKWKFQHEHSTTQTIQYTNDDQTNLHLPFCCAA